MALHSEDPEWLRLMESDPALWSERWYPHLAARQVETLQRAARFLVRLWTLGPAQGEGKKLKGSLRRFLSLTDDQLASCRVSQPQTCSRLQAFRGSGQTSSPAAALWQPPAGAAQDAGTRR